MKSLQLPTFLFIFLLNLHLSAQNKEIVKEDEPKLKDDFTEGHFHGHIRNFYMNTINRGELKDYYTNATGGAVSFTTGNFKGFQFGVKGIFTYRTFGSDLGVRDAVTGKNAKWEYELYDVLNKGNFQDLNGLQGLFIRYRFGNSYISYGKLETEFSPLLNNSNGRMKPFAHRGAWSHLNISENHQLNLGWLDGVSPRSTTGWFAMDEAIGLFYNGFQPNGEVAVYREIYSTTGIGILNYHFRKDNFQMNFYDFYLDKVMNTIWTELGYDLADFNLGFQYVYQNPLSYSEDLASVNRYVQPYENGQVLSSQLSWKKTRFNVAFAYTHAFDSGRFLFPKELGRDRFFTSIPRSRLEGLGNTDVFTIKAEYHLPKPNLHFGLEMQQLDGPETGKLKFNKYNIDESFQVNSHLSYQAHGFLEGLSFDILWIFRENQNHTDAQSIFNKSNFNQLNFVTNFNF
ncbi:hypothetical protein [Salegentibacter salinarum]|uniref:hypothetical protein n=1 Tax=Salegentibacter salinarum TaxID=447422 RepID=UPI00117B6D5F|nr:hypothetical protein [Salegentibacter salinarum]